MINKNSITNGSSNSDVQVGFRFLINESAWEVTYLNNEIDVIRLREVNGSRTFTNTIKGFKKRIRLGSAKLQRGISQLTLASLTEATLNDKERRAYEKRKAYVALMDTLPSNASNEKTREAIVRLHEKRASQQIAENQEPESKPGLSTVFEWRRNVRNASGLLLALANKDHRSKKRKHRLSDDVFGMLRESFEQIYKREQRFTISDIHSVITARVRLENENRDSALPPLKAPCRQTISENLATFDPLGAYEARFGKHKARMSFNYGGRISVPDYVCGLVYADSHLMDVLVRDELLDITYRPWLLTLMCASTRCIIGYEISALPPSAEKLTRALRMAITESNYSEFRGTPAMLVVDNGSEFRNGTHRTIAAQLGFQITFPPPRTPNAKSPQERFFRTLNYFIHRLSGSVGSNPFDKGDYDSEGNSIYTLPQIIEKFQDILTIYHHRSLASLGQAPKTLWEINFDKQPPRVFDAEFVRTLGSQTKNVSIHKGQVKINGIAWHAPSLPELELRLKRAGKKAIVHYDVSDLTYAWVRHPNEPDTAVRCDPHDPEYQTGLTMKLHEEITKEKHRLEEETGNVERMHFLKARFILKAMRDAIVKKCKARKTNRGHVEWHDQLIRAADTMNNLEVNQGPSQSRPLTDAGAAAHNSDWGEQIDLGWDDVPSDFQQQNFVQPIQPTSSGWDDVPASY